MPLIPVMRCRDMRVSVSFYTGILDFERTDATDDPAEHDFITLCRGSDRLALSHDDGVFGTVVVVATSEVDGAFRLFRTAWTADAWQSGRTDPGS